MFRLSKKSTFMRHQKFIFPREFLMQMPSSSLSLCFIQLYIGVKRYSIETSVCFGIIKSLQEHAIYISYSLLPFPPLSLLRSGFSLCVHIILWATKGKTNNIKFYCYCAQFNITIIIPFKTSSERLRMNFSCLHAKKKKFPNTIRVFFWENLW